MNKQEIMDPEVRELLDTLNEHGENQRRQQQLAHLIDDLEAAERPRRRGARVWPWIGVAAAACMALWIVPDRAVVAPVPQTTAPQVAQVVAVAERPEILREPEKMEKLAKPERPSVLEILEEPEVLKEPEIFREPEILEIPEDSEESEGLEVLEGLEVPVEKPHYRVVSARLVCYAGECPTRRSSDKEAPDHTIFGTPISPNMDGGMLMLASL